MKLEHWTCDAGRDSVAVLNVPAALHRSRTFDIDVSLEVTLEAPKPWHELVVEIDGRRQWGRRIASHSPADGLDYHCRLTVESDQELRLRAIAQTQGVGIHRLVIEASEVV